VAVAVVVLTQVELLVWAVMAVAVVAVHLVVRHILGKLAVRAL
jgi:hypothetical protein